KRQVTVLSEEAFNEACAELGAALPWTIRRANLLISGINLENSKGKSLEIGDVVLEITGETDPCYRMDEQFEGLKDALQPNWRGGVTCRVVSEGNINLGDEVNLV
ncbi:MAG: MOSC domain-containing protein, partial [Bacteroidetes bacterium]|nr:MOSC domain-containing protein [Bacteroidota bacterium]